LCRFFKADIVQDVADDSKSLRVDLLPPKKDFLSDYTDMQQLPGEEVAVRPVGIPGVFFPLDTCGRILHRRGMTLKLDGKNKTVREFVVSVYTKSEVENPERGLVIKLYDRNSSNNAGRAVFYFLSAHSFIHIFFGC